MRILENETQADYQSRINKVFNYIDENLDTDLSLEIVAQVASFSPFHFHRIFKFITEETLNAYITRQRVEKSASDLIHKKITVTEISLKYGFKDNSSFTRTFKKYYGVSPTVFRKQNPNKFSKIRQLNSKNGQGYPDYEKYICILNNLKNWMKMNAKIEVKKMPQMDLAYVSSIGSENLQGAYQKLLQWATPKGLMNEDAKVVTIYHDSFKVTEASKVRMSACVTYRQKPEIAGEIGLTTITEGKCIVGSYTIHVNEFQKSWTGLFMWMNENGYKMADKKPFEIYHNNFNAHPEKKCIVDFCIPVQ